MTISKLIKEAAARMVYVTVDMNPAFETVCISTKGQEDIFMQGEDAAQFIREVEALYEEAQDVTMDEAADLVAEGYVDNIWG